MAKVYTKTGDRGDTSLVGGSRVSKSDTLIDLYGEVDNLNSFIGFGMSSLDEKLFKEELDLLKEIQNNLFNLGSLLACEKEKRETFSLPTVKSELIKKIESRIDELSNELPPMKNFVLPGGSEQSSRFHMCRTIARGVERKLIKYFIEHDDDVLNSKELLNRLSDYFFTISRVANIRSNVEEILWSKN